MFRLRIYLRRIFVALCVFLWFVISSNPAQAVEVLPELAQQILQVMQDNPQQLMETLIRYQEEESAAAEAAQKAQLETFRQSPNQLISQSPTRGPSNAKTVVVEFSDFQCPFCQEAHTALNDLHMRHPEVLIAYKHLPLVQIHDQAIPAAQAAWAAHQQGKFWPYHDQLFTHQNELSEGLYVQIAQDLGLNVDRFESDRQSQAAMDEIMADLALADQVGASGTPLFLVLGSQSAQVMSGVDIEQLETALAQVA